MAVKYLVLKDVSGSSPSKAAVAVLSPPSSNNAGQPSVHNGLPPAVQIDEGRKNLCTRYGYGSRMLIQLRFHVRAIVLFLVNIDWISLIPNRFRLCTEFIFSLTDNA